MKRISALCLLSVLCLAAVSGCGSEEEQSPGSQSVSVSEEPLELSSLISENISEVVQDSAEAEVIPAPEVTPYYEPVSLSFICVGDNLTHQSMIDYGMALGGDWHYMYENIAWYIQLFDVAVVNQETPLVEDPAEFTGYPDFGTPYGVADASVDAGFDIFLCASNHSLDKWVYGVDSTISYYDSHGLAHAGTQSSAQTDYIPYVIYEQNGIRCAILNYTYGCNDRPMPDENPNMVHLLNDEARIREDIALAAADADVVLVFPHWGDEYSIYVNDQQRYWTQVFYESGADVVVGAHPHVVEPYEMISDGAGHDMLVFYSVGNFVSGQTELDTILGGAATFTVTKTADGCSITSYGFEPLVTHESDPMRSSVFRLADYDDYLCELHNMNISTEMLWSMFNSYSSM